MDTPITPKTDFWTDTEVIYSYSRQQAIEDGVLIDVSSTARQAGFRYPVALTSSVWYLIEDIPDRLKGFEDVNGRLWDVLYMASLAARRAELRNQLIYRLILNRNVNGRAVKYLDLKMVCGPGDTPAPVITIMLPDED